MKKLQTLGIGILLTATFGLAGCGSRSSTNFNFNAKDVKYDIDTRTGRCFAAVGTRRAAALADGMSISYTPCDADTLKLIDPAHIAQTRANGIPPKL